MSIFNEMYVLFSSYKQLLRVVRFRTNRCLQDQVLKHALVNIQIDDHLRPGLKFSSNFVCNFYKYYSFGHAILQQYC